MAEAAARFGAAGRGALAAWAAHKARDERGHDRLALRDLEALGYDAERVVEALVPPTAAALVAYFGEAVHAADPVRCVGYAYALERLALGQTEAYVKRVEAMLPAGVYATRCLRVHSAVGSDAGHVAETIAMVAGLSAPERAEIALACYETTALCYAPKGGGIIAEDTLARMLSTLKTKAG
jgi:pyrroloquinoline quinone (PQQ) biosynthesis protein C